MSRHERAVKLPSIITKKLRKTLPDGIREQTADYLRQVQAHLSLRHRHNEFMLNDHLEALCLFMKKGIAFDEAIRIFSPDNLGDFYSGERAAWYPLDHAAKVYPLSMTLKTMPIFRLSGYFKEPIEPAVMQMALNYTMKRFPYFATTIKCGFFWHYIDSAMRRFALKPETKRPCAPMRLGEVSSPTLRVVYYMNRISVEFFHVLTDGSGGAVFLRTLMCEYLRLMGNKIPVFEGMLEPSEMPKPEEWHDSFVLSDKASDSTGFGAKPALQLRGMLAYERPHRVLHYNLSVAELKERAHKRGVKITTLMLGYLFLALRDACPLGSSRKRIQVQLPVNMRTYYPSGTLRNFSMYCNIGLAPHEITTLEDILPSIDAQVRKGTSKESLDKTMQLSRKLVSTLRFIPLVVKRPIVKLVYGALSDTVFTTTFSNLGAVSSSEEFEKHVDKLDFVLGAPVRNRASCSMCSFGGKAVFTVTKNTSNTLFEDSLYNYLTDDGLKPYMEGTQ